MKRLGRASWWLGWIPPGIWLLNPRTLQVTGGDGWWLACYARAWMETGNLPTRVIGLFSLPDGAYHHPAWLYGWWSFLGLSLGGPRLWVWMDTLIPLGLAALAANRILAKEGLSPPLRAGLVGWMGALTWVTQTQRGQVWAIAFFLWLLEILRDVLVSPTFPRRARWGIPLTVWLWAGFHGGFLLPLGMAGLAWLFRPSRAMTFTLITAALVTLLHPYAPQNWMDHLLILRHPPGFIWEWLSLPEAIRHLQRTFGEPLGLVLPVAVLPYLIALLPLLWMRETSRWDRFLSFLTALFAVGGIFRIRQVLWAVQGGGLLWGRVLRRWEPRIVPIWTALHALLALQGYALRVPTLLQEGVTGWAIAPATLEVVQTLSEGRTFATLKIANTLCWLNPHLSQWMYGTFQLGLARTSREWHAITRDVVAPWIRLPASGGDSAVRFLQNHRVTWVMLHHQRDTALIRTLRGLPCAREVHRGPAFTLWNFRGCLAETPAGSPPQWGDPGR